MSNTETIALGDRMRFSTELLKHIHKAPKHHSILVQLKEIRIEDDGAKLLVLDRVDE